ncbi:hypothetical protein B0H19DRAFT_1260298 [Mycena capillaripes]|nr:hypothetical protein B0H19DRAFT_1260298 [Mycena capillaripes]
MPQICQPSRGSFWGTRRTHLYWQSGWPNWGGGDGRPEEVASARRWGRAARGGGERQKEALVGDDDVAEERVDVVTVDEEEERDVTKVTLSTKQTRSFFCFYSISLNSLFASQTTMPPIRTRQRPSASELQRRRELAAISRIRDPIDQALAHIAHPCYKDFRGDLYTVCRVVRVFDHELQMWVGAFDIKSGFSIDAVRRQFDYRDTCHDIEFIWFYKYKSDTVKLLEPLVHLTLRALGATIASYPCPGCGVRHREFYSYSAAGGIEGLCSIIEFWLGAMGQRVEKILIDPIS